jgi:hypothetical protein
MLVLTGLFGNILASERNIREEVGLRWSNDATCLVDSEGTCMNDIIANTSVFLTLCTTVRTNVHIMVEWIEFMRMQGVDRFVIYDDESTDSLPLLVPFYRQRDPPLDIIIRPRIINESNYHRQLPSFDHCLQTYGKFTEWLLISDTDEYFFAPAHLSFRAMLEDIPRMEKERNVEVQHIHISCSRFGSSGQRRRQQYRFEQLPNSTVVYRNGCGEQLVVNQVLRGPDAMGYRDGKEKEEKMFQRLREAEVCTRTSARTGTIGCHYDPGKSVHRPRHVAEVSVHYAAAFADGHTEAHSREGNWLLSPHRPLAWCNHYWFRSREDCAARATEQWMQADLHAMLDFYDDADKGFYGQVQDTLVRDAWGEELARRVGALTTFGGDCPLGSGPAPKSPGPATMIVPSSQAPVESI